MKLRSSHLDMEIHDKAADQAESDLRDDEPRPVDTRVKNGTDHANRGIEDSCPQKGCDESSGEDGLPRKHRQHGSVEPADEDRGENVDSRGSEQPLDMKLGQKGVALSSPADETAGGQKVYRIPDAVITEKGKA